ncbi:MAG: hypothetical protein WDM90_13400 [Ferruginibacter sp.]
MINREFKRTGIFFYLKLFRPVLKKDTTTAAANDAVNLSHMAMAVPVEGSAILYIDSITNDYALRFPYKLMVHV